MDRSMPQTAMDLLKRLSAQELEDIIRVYGEERFARSIAHAIVEARSRERILTTDALVKAVLAGTPVWYHKRKIHPATKTFQALRIAVNAELASIEAGVTAAWEHVAVGGRIAVITFHSIEDRAVKRLFLSLVKEGGRLVVKKPLVPSREEVSENPSARSAKLRVIQKTPQNNI